MIESMSELDYNQIQPNCEEFSIDDMDQKTRETFLYLTTAYRYLLMEYLNRRINLEGYDKSIQESNLKFVEINPDSMDIYQYYCLNTLKYIYLRNNVHIAHLTNEERDLFLTLIKNSDMTYNDDIDKFIDSTFRKVIFEPINNDEIIDINYGPMSNTFLAANNALVFGIRHDEFNLNGMTDSDWDQNHDNQIRFLNTLSTTMEKDVMNKLKINCRVISYNDTSVVKKNNDELVK